MTTQFILDFFDRSAKEPQPVAAVKVRDSLYRGLPDDHKIIKTTADLPPLVIRRLILAESIRKNARSEWSKIRHNGQGPLVLDLQLED